MKKFVVILILGTFCQIAAFAEEKCDELLDFNWHFQGRTTFNKVSKDFADRANFEFKSRSGKDIKIARVYLKTKDKNIVKERKLTSFYIPAYGKDHIYIYDLDKINLDVVSFGGYSCLFEKKPITKKKKYKFKQKSWSQKMLDKIKGN